MTRSRTLTITSYHSRVRTYSISLPPVKPSLDTLPAEILLDVIRYAIPQPSKDVSTNKVHALALVSKTLAAAHAAVLYRTVVLRTRRALELFARTARMRPTLLSAHVHALAVTSDELKGHELREELGIVLRTCASVHTLVLPGSALRGLVLPKPSVPLPFPTPKHVTLSDWAATPEWFQQEPQNVGRPLGGVGHVVHVIPSSEMFKETTHLSVAGPSMIWTRPRDILSALGYMPKLTHLHLARRVGGNEDNDAEFIDDVRAARVRVKNITVSMCQRMYSASHGDGDAIRDALDKAGVALREGTDGEWQQAWLAAEVGEHACGKEERYWARV